VEFIFADDQYLFCLQIYTKSAKINSATKSSAQISFTNNFFPKVFLFKKEKVYEINFKLTIVSFSHFKAKYIVFKD